RDDFALDPPAGYQRLAPGRTVRLRHGYCVTCDEVLTDDAGEVVGLRVSHVPDTVGNAPEGVKVSGVIHWVSAPESIPAEVRLYDRLFRDPRPEDGAGDFTANLNPESLEIVPGARVEPSLAGAEPGSRWQFERVGYFAVDPVDSRPGSLVFNRIVTLRDSWAGRAELAGGTGAPSTATGELDVTRRATKASTRPPKKSRTEYRAEARRRDPVLAERFAAWPAAHGLSEADTDLLTGDRATGDLFEGAVVAAGASAAPAVARWIINEVPRELGERELADVPMTAAALGSLVSAVESKAISGPAGKEVFAVLMEQGGDPEQIIAERGLAQVSDEGAIAAMVEEAIAANPDKVEAYRAGKTALAGFFVGQVVRASQGKANPQVIQKLVAERLG
ncbi:MAG: glutaminyl-tRNA synthetase, partial [Actinomycetota bacterium]|nr:glutaminyl-tRNA synthetase [Actinomycetota bacterium]